MDLGMQNQMLGMGGNGMEELNYGGNGIQQQQHQQQHQQQQQQQQAMNFQQQSGQQRTSTPQDALLLRYHQQLQAQMAAAGRPASTQAQHQAAAYVAAFANGAGSRGILPSNSLQGGRGGYPQGIDSGLRRASVVGHNGNYAMNQAHGGQLPATAHSGAPVLTSNMTSHQMQTSARSSISIGVDQGSPAAMSQPQSSQMLAQAQQHPPSSPAHAPTPNTSAPAPSVSATANSVAIQQQQLLMNRAAAGGGQVPGQPRDQSKVEKARIALLLEINAVLLKESMEYLQGPKNAQENNGPDRGMTAILKRMQVNLAYLAALADRNHKGTPVPATLAVLTPPLDMPQLNEPYKKLQELFAGIKPGPNSPAHPNPQAAAAAQAAAMQRPRAASQSKPPGVPHSPMPQPSPGQQPGNLPGQPQQQRQNSLHAQQGMMDPAMAMQMQQQQAQAQAQQQAQQQQMAAAGQIPVPMMGPQGQMMHASPAMQQQQQHLQAQAHAQAQAQAQHVRQQQMAAQQRMHQQRQMQQMMVAGGMAGPVPGQVPMGVAGVPMGMGMGGVPQAMGQGGMMMPPQQGMAFMDPNQAGNMWNGSYQPQ